MAHLLDVGVGYRMRLIMCLPNLDGALAHMVIMPSGIGDFIEEAYSEVGHKLFPSILA